MNYMLKYSFTCLLLLVVFASCRKEPNYPDEPQISFKRIEQFAHDANNLQIDSIFLVIGFQDGDGNLGLSSDDKSADYNPPFQKGSIYENNFKVRLQKQVPDSNKPGEFTFIDYKFPVEGFDLSGRFPRISSDDRKEPLEGEIRFGMEFTEEFFVPGEVIRFEVFIYDRETPVPNKSNVIVTDPVTLFK